MIDHGMFYVADEEAAARCVDAKAIKLMGDAAELNYPEMNADEREARLTFLQKMCTPLQVKQDFCHLLSNQIRSRMVTN